MTQSRKNKIPVGQVPAYQCDFRISMPTNLDKEESSYRPDKQNAWMCLNMWYWYVWLIYFRNPKSNSRTWWEDSPAKPAFWGDLGSFSLARCCICTAVYIGILSCCGVSMYVPGAPVPIRLEAPPQPLAWVMNQVPAVLKITEWIQEMGWANICWLYNFLIALFDI